MAIRYSVIVTGDNVEVNLGAPRAKNASLREAYLSYVLEQVSPLALSGVVRQSASEAETRLNLSAVYTALMTIPFIEYLHPGLFDNLNKTWFSSQIKEKLFQSTEFLYQVKLMKKHQKNRVDEINLSELSQEDIQELIKDISGVKVLYPALRRIESKTKPCLAWRSRKRKKHFC